MAVELNKNFGEAGGVRVDGDFSFFTRFPNNGEAEARKQREILLKDIWEKRYDLRRYVVRLGAGAPLEIHLRIKGGRFEANEDACRTEFMEFVRLTSLQ
jgi:hypothetical protein